MIELNIWQLLVGFVAAMGIAPFPKKQTSKSEQKQKESQ